MSSIQAVFFDVDGVLLNSLPQHLQICKDLAPKYAPGVSVPDEAAFKKMVREGRRISPMRYFFTTVGFSEDAAVQADREYQKTFMSRYHPEPFDGVPGMLRNLREAGLSLGIVTSNVEDNVRAALGDCMKCFEKNCCFTIDGPKGLDKSDALLEGCRLLEIKPDQAIFVGDQIADRQAAERAGIPFLGVSYGWCFSDRETEIAIADSPEDVAIYILARVALSYQTKAVRHEQWERYKEAAGAEKQWMNERLGWLFTPQGILFAAFSITLRADEIADKQLISGIQIVLPFLGIAISVVVLLTVLAAAVMHAKWFGELQRIVKKSPYDGLTFGSAPDWPARVARSSPVAIPVFFIIAWLCMLGFTLIMFVQSAGG